MKAEDPVLETEVTRCPFRILGTGTLGEIGFAAMAAS